MKKMILVLAMIAASSLLSNCSNCNPCAGTCAPTDCCGSNSYNGNWF